MTQDTVKFTKFPSKEIFYPFAECRGLYLKSNDSGLIVVGTGSPRL